jgi:sugar phosphate permease
MGSITLVLTVLTWLVVADRPEDRGLPSVTGEACERRPTGRVGPGIARVLGDRRFWPLAVWNLLMGVSLFGFCGLWAGPYLNDVYRLSRAGAANILAMIAIALIFGGPFLSYISEKVFHSRKKVLVGCSVIHLVCWLVLLLLPAALPYPALYAVFFLMGLTAGAATPVVITATKELFPLEMAGISVGMVNIFPFLGGIISQPFIGLLLDLTRGTAGAQPVKAYRMVFLLFFVMSIGALWCIGKARERAKEGSPAVPAAG